MKMLTPHTLLVTWNLFVLTLLLSLCLLIWFSRLYTSWACVRSVNEVLLLCQFTVLVRSVLHNVRQSLPTVLQQVQCWPCPDAADCVGVDVCVVGGNTPYHCMSPLPMANGGVKVINAMITVVQISSTCYECSHIAALIDCILRLQLQYWSIHIHHR